MLILGALATKIAKAAAVIVAAADIWLLQILGTADIWVLWIFRRSWICRVLGVLRKLFNFLNIIMEDHRLLIRPVKVSEDLK